MHTQIIQYLNQIIPLNPSQQNQLNDLLEYQDVPKDSVLLEVGQVSDRLYFMVEGVLRAYYIRDGKEHTSWLGFENEFAYSVSSFVKQTPSIETMVTISDCTFSTLSYTNLQFLFHQDPVWNTLGRLLFEDTCIRLYRRIHAYQSLSAAERYDQIEKRHPDILNRVKLAHVASYLAMTPETLSRLRATKKRRRKLQH